MVAHLPIDSISNQRTNGGPKKAGLVFTFGHPPNVVGAIATRTSNRGPRDILFQVPVEEELSLPTSATFTGDWEQDDAQFTLASGQAYEYLIKDATAGPGNSSRVTFANGANKGISNKTARVLNLDDNAGTPSSSTVQVTITF